MKTSYNKTGRGKPVKQLNRKPQRQVTRRTNAQSARPYKDQVTQIPATMAYTINNRTNINRHTERAKEYLGTIPISGNTPTGRAFVFALNPLHYPATRFGRLASSYQKFRFRNCRLTIASNFSTTVSGSIIAGYMENPDQEILPEPYIFNQVFSATNGVSQSLWKPIDISARFMDKAKWYNIDNDSDEIMQTTQGKFVIVVQSPVAVTSQVQIPILLEYDIEFMGSATQPLNTSPFGETLTLTGSVYTQRSSEDAGEYHPTTPTTVVENVVYYFIEGAQQIKQTDGTLAFIQCMVYNSLARRSHSFYQSIGDASNLINKVIALDETFTLPSAYIAPVNF